MKDDASVEVMLDLETLGTRPGCKVLSIGAVVFGPAGLGAEFYTEVQRDFQGWLHEDDSTVEWWGRQAPEVRNRLFNDAAGKPRLLEALGAFGQWLKLVASEESAGLMANIWGNGADFDNAILAVAYNAVSVGNPPWPFYRNRCYRTLKSLKPECKLVRSDNLHNALDDAKSQAEHAVRLLKELGLWA